MEGKTQGKPEVSTKLEIVMSAPLNVDTHQIQEKNVKQGRHMCGQIKCPSRSLNVQFVDLRETDFNEIWLDIDTSIKGPGPVHLRTVGAYVLSFRPDRKINIGKDIVIPGPGFFRCRHVNTLAIFSHNLINRAIPR